MANFNFKISLISIIVIQAYCTTTFVQGQGSTFTNPILSVSSPDPFVVRINSTYYMVLSDSHTKIFVLKSEYLTNWREAYDEKVQVYEAPEGMDNLFAPELHYLNDAWHIYFAYDNKTDAQHRMYVIRALEDKKNPQSLNYSASERVSIDSSVDFFAIDGTILEVDDKRYFIYSGWENATLDKNCTDNLPDAECYEAYMWIAEMSDYKTLIGDRVLLKKPEEDWEGKVIEAAQIYRVDYESGDFRIFMFYSGGSTWDESYTMAVMYLDPGKDPMIPSDWVRWPCKEVPLFWKNDVAQVYGPGHGMIVDSPSGNQHWIIYHAMDPSFNGENRTARTQEISFESWGNGGFPVFPRPASFNDILKVPQGQRMNSSNFLKPSIITCTITTAIIITFLRYFI